MKSATFYLCTAILLDGCSGPPPDAQFTPVLPDRATFPEVAVVLADSCGTLDCHGSPSRNLRVYGSEGLRFSSADRPFSPPCMTTDETDQDFESFVDLEPEVLSAVVRDGGAEPERLTIVRKARGLESHKGGTLFQAGDDRDTCLTTWLSGKIDSAACRRIVLNTTCPSK